MTQNQGNKMSPTEGHKHGYGPHQTQQYCPHSGFQPTKPLKQVTLM